MSSSELGAEQQRWLLAIDDAPLTQAAAAASMPRDVLDALLGHGMVHWRTGFLDVVLLEITARGAVVAERLRG